MLRLNLRANIATVLFVYHETTKTTPHRKTCIHACTRVCVCVSSLYTYYTYNYSLTCIYTLIKTKEKIDTDVREQRARREKRRHDCNPKIALKISGNAPRFRHFTLVPRRDRATIVRSTRSASNKQEKKLFLRMENRSGLLVVFTRCSETKRVHSKEIYFNDYVVQF